MQPPRLYQPVRLRKDIPGAGLPRGTSGRIVDLNPADPLHVEVEFHVEDGSRFGRYIEQIVPLSILEVEEPTPWSASPEVTSTLQRLRDGHLTLDAKGGTEAEVAALESRLRSRLPASYRTFLLALGNDSQEFMRGSDLALKDLTRINEEARRLVAAAGQTLSAAAFAFLMHQGYQFLCFNLGEGDDPQVHHFMEQETLKPLGMTFSEWFRRAADDAIQDCKEPGR